MDKDPSSSLWSNKKSTKNNTQTSHYSLKGGHVFSRWYFIMGYVGAGGKRLLLDAVIVPTLDRPLQYRLFSVDRKCANGAAR